MTKYDYDIAVLGGGSAGLTVTAGASQLGAKTLLIEKEPVLGGDCLHFGCVPSKTLIRSAHIYHLIKNAEKFGLPPVDVAPVDYRKIAERIRSVISIIQEHDSPERFCKLGAKVDFGQAEFIDEHTVRLNGQNISAAKWVISTGSSPEIPSIPGLDSTPFITNKEIFFLERLPASMAVLGAGPIAIEMAQAFSRLGSKVHVIQRSGQILSKEDRDMADEVMNVMKQEGIAFHLNAMVSLVRDLGSEREIMFTSGEVKTSLKVDTILVALGRRPNIFELGLQQIGIKHSTKGLMLDKKLRTNHKHIFGAGDVTGEHQFTHAAGYEGGIIVSNAIFHLPRSASYTYMPWCTYTDPELASIGMNEKRAKEAGIKYTVWTEEFKGNDRSLAEGEFTGKIKLLLDEKSNPLGVQILGPQAGELISEWVASLNGKVKLSALAGAVHPYPTLAEINKRVVGNYFSGKIFSEKVRKGLKFFFDYKGRACGTE